MDRKEDDVFPPYPAYRDSGVEWLGEVPAHWGVRRLKTIAAVQLSNVDKKTIEEEQSIKLCNYTDVYYNEQIRPELEFMQASATEEQIRKFALRAGDVLITKDSESWNDIAVPSVVMEDMPRVLCGYHLAHIRPSRGLEGQYLSRAFSASGLREQFHILAKGITRFGLGGDEIREGVFPIPPLEEQRAITAFLDRETARIDALIAKKERLIELLEEQRRALITHAVTRGLDPDAPMKDSGIEWLGEVPAHWEISRISYVADVGNGSTPSRGNIDYWSSGDIPWLTSGKINDDVIREADQFVSRKAVQECHLPVAKSGSVLIALTGEGQTRGRVAMLCFESTISQYLAFISVRNKKADNFFIWKYLQSQYERLRSESGGAGSTRAALTCAYIKAIQIVLPPLKEQKLIYDYLQSCTRVVEDIGSKIKLAVESLKVYRIALISSAVTGKIDVRNHEG